MLKDEWAMYLKCSMASTKGTNESAEDGGCWS
jgi:hypothetical protein